MQRTLAEEDTSGQRGCVTTQSNWTFFRCADWKWQVVR